MLQGFKLCYMGYLFRNINHLQCLCFLKFIWWLWVHLMNIVPLALLSRWTLVTSSNYTNKKPSALWRMVYLKTIIPLDCRGVRNIICSVRICVASFLLASFYFDSFSPSMIFELITTYLLRVKTQKSQPECWAGI